MSRRGDVIRLRQQLGKRFGKRQPLLQRWVGLMGDGEGNLYPDPTDPNYVFVRRTGRARVERVRNVRVMARNNLPVIVGFSPERPDEQQVLDTDDTALTTLGAYGYVKNHHQQHELHNPDGGDDTVWVFTQQFLYFLCQVTDPISEFLQVRDGIFLYQGVYRIFPGATTVDMTTFAPGAGLAVMVLISVNANTGFLTYTAGADFADTVPSDLWITQVPVVPDASIPIAAIYVPNGATTFDWDYILDWRVFINVAGDVQPHNILSASHTDAQTDTLVRGDFLVVGAGPPPLLSRFPIGAAYELIRMNAGASDPEWGNVHATMMPHTILDGAAHTDSVLQAVAQGMMMLGDGTPEWAGLAHPGGAAYHLQTSAVTAVWNQDITMATGHWIGLGGGAGRAEFINAADDEINILDANVGVGTSDPNISGEARAITIEDAVSSPVLELSLRDDIFGADTLIGIIRWYAGNVNQCAVGQIDVIQSAWYETNSTMRFWAVDDCALCLRQTISCTENLMGDIAGGNYTEIEEDGTLEFVGDATVWEDARIIPGAFQFPGNSDPTLRTWQPGGAGTIFYVWCFSSGDEAFFTVQIPHSYDQGEDIYAHVHWTPRSFGVAENGSTVAWKLDYSWANIDGVFGASATVDLTDTCNGVNHRHEITSDVVIAGAGKTISSMLICRVYRDAGDTWAGGAADSPALLEVDFHFPIDTVGSRQRLVK